MDIDFLANLMENMPDAIYFKDRSSRFLSINKALADLYGLDDPSLAFGKTDFDFYPKEQATEMMADERRIVLSGEPIVGKEEYETMSDGRQRWFSTTKLPLHDRRGGIVGTLGISREITAQKEAEEALRAAHRQLERKGMHGPGDLLASLNKHLFEMLGRSANVVFTTAFSCTLDAESGELTYANAGHPFPIIQRSGSGTVEVLGSTGSSRGAALALYHDSDYPVCREHVEEGDRILLFTDGLFEASSRTGEVFGEGRLREAADRLVSVPSPVLAEKLVDEVAVFADHARLGDDVCLLLVERSGI